jgi:hypothetical protein
MADAEETLHPAGGLIVWLPTDCVSPFDFGAVRHEKYGADSVHAPTAQLSCITGRVGISQLPT